MTEFKQFRELERGEFIVVGVDTAVGGNDYCAAQFLSHNKLDVPVVYHSRKMATEMTPEIKNKLEEIYNITGIAPLVAYERNNGGSFELERLARLNKDGKYQIFKMPTRGQDNPPEAVKYGWDTNTATRPAMLSSLKEAIDRKLIKIYDKATLNEMLSFIISQTSSSWKAQAERGANDDLVMALAIAYQLYQICPLETIKTPTRYERVGTDDDLGFSRKFEVKRKWWWQEEEHQSYQKREI